MRPRAPASFTNSVVVVAVSFFAVACGEPEVLLTSTTMTAEDGSLVPLRAGTTLKRRWSMTDTAGPGADEEVDVKLRDGRTGRVARHLLRAFPMTGERRFVVVPWAPEFKEAEKGGALRRRHRAGTGLDVVAIDDGLLAVVEGGAPVGFVPADHFADHPPTAAEIFAHVMRGLRALDVEQAVDAARETLHLDPHHIAALEVMWASEVGDDWARAKEWKAKLKALRGEERPWPSLPVSPVKPGGAFVTASNLRLRQEPSPTARVVAYLEIATPVVVESIDAQGWARVSVHQGEKIDLDSRERAAVVDAAVSAAPPVRVLHGALKAEYLAPERPDETKLVEHARAAESQGLYDEATLWRQRHLALSGHTPELARAVVDDALRAERMSAAYFAARPPQAASAGTANGIRVALSLAFGCRGDPRAATEVVDTFDDTIDVERVARELPSDACVVHVETKAPCAPDEPYDAAIDFVGLGGDESELTPEQAVIVARRNAENAASHQERMAEHAAAVASFDERQRRLAELFPSGPVLTIGIENAAAVGAPHTLYLAEITYEPSGGECGGYALEGRAERLRPLPDVTLQKTAELLARVPRVQNVTYLVIAAIDEGAARREAEAHAVSFEDRYRPPPDPPSGPRPLGDAETVGRLEAPMAFCQEPCGC